MGQRSKRLTLVSCVFVAVAWCCRALPAEASAGEPRLAFGETLEAPGRLEARVRFWVDVFTRWSVEQAIVQDRDRPWVVFAVVPIERPSRQELARVETEYEDLARRVHRALEHPGTRSSAPVVGEGGEVWRRLLPPVAPSALAEARNRIEVRPGQREIFRDSLARSQPLVGTMKRMVRDAGLPEEIAYLPHVESSFNAEARSNVGAVGIWQLMPETARRTLRVDGDRDERRDPVRSTQAAARYFREAHDALGSWPLAVTSYNYGVNGMRRAVETLGTTDLVELIERHDSPAFGYSAKNFFAQFLAAVHIARNEDFYFRPKSRRGTGAATPTQEVAARARCERPDAPPADLALAFRSPDPAIAFPAADRSSPVATTAPVRLASLVTTAATTSRAPTTSRAEPSRARAATVNSPVGQAGERTRTTVAEAASSARAARPRREYVVRKGDSLWTIARQHGTTVEAIRSANRDVSTSAQLQLGQRLLIEG
ncbi:MAG: transglycosylase SLT domain-containing protein [Alphaproteobacteria bacterium]